MLEYPLSPQSKGSIEDAKFAKIQARTILGGLPIFTATRDITINKPIQGEIWLEDIGGTQTICAYISGTKRTVKLT